MISPIPCNTPIEQPIKKSVEVKFSGKFIENKIRPMTPWLRPTNRLKLFIERLNSDNTLLSVILTMAKIIGFKIAKSIQGSTVIKFLSSIYAPFF
tara:strand:+ start:6393 stop:6677 length:285 start_codon:yes stop_codon:yes gene_type:complete